MHSCTNALDFSVLYLIESRKIRFSRIYKTAKHIGGENVREETCDFLFSNRLATPVLDPAENW